MKHLLRDRLNNYIKKSHWYNEVMFRDCRKFWDIQDEKYEVINLGSSSGVYDFSYDECGLNGGNWAVAPQSTLGDFVILKQFRNHIKNGGIVIYPLCPFTAISGAVPYLEERCYSFVDYKNYPGGHYISNFKIQSIKENPLPVYPLVEFLRDIKWRFSRHKDCIKSEKEFEIDAELKIKGWKDQFGISSLDEKFIDHFEGVYNDTIGLISEIIDFCHAEGLKIVFVVPPVYHTLSELITNTAREQLSTCF